MATYRAPEKRTSGSVSPIDHGGFGDGDGNGDGGKRRMDKHIAADPLELETQLVESERYGHTKRGLKSRHVQLIALGGAIGTGLFVGSGATLSLVGPAPLFMAFCVMSIIIYWVMNALAEMTVYIPMPGASPSFYVNRFFEPSLAFAAGWNYWYTYSILIAAEISAASVVIQYWTTSVNVAVWISILLVLVIALNIFVVSIYGEAEFWFASIKLITITGLIILGIVIFFGGAPDHTRLGFYYWQDPGAFVSFPHDGLGDTGRFLGFWTALVRSGFAFILSPELVAITAGESEAPRRNIPKASRRFVYRLMFFYCLGSLVITVIVASNDPHLLSAVKSKTSDAGASPFVLGIQNAGIPVLNHIINAVIVTSAASAANSFLYAASRNLYSLSITHQAPAIFQKCNKQGVPWLAVLFSAALACLVYLSVSSGSNTVFNWFLNLTTISGFIAWIVLLMTYLRFRKALIYNGVYDSRPYRTKLQPYTTWAALFILVLLTLTNGFQVFFPGSFTASDFLAAYITIPAFIVLYVGHKIFFRTPFVRRVSDVDVVTGKEEADALEAADIPPVPKNLVQRIWFFIA